MTALPLMLHSLGEPSAPVLDRDMPSGFPLIVCGHSHPPTPQPQAVIAPNKWEPRATLSGSGFLMFAPTFPQQSLARAQFP
jgi:hypothetical protein